MLFEGFARRAFGFGSAASGTPGIVAEDGRHLKLGLALGGGAARGWAHIGVIQTLVAAGVRPDVVSGCSIGAVVGGCYAAGKLAQLETFARSLTRRRIMGLLDFHIGGSGLIGGDKLRKLLDLDLADVAIDDLPLRFGCVATEYATGHEIWLTKGGLVEAMRASYALPGVFHPVKIGDRWLMDGALVNPVPVTVARALGADLVICVNLNADIKLRGTVIQSPARGEPDTVVDALMGAPQARRALGNPPQRAGREKDAPGFAAVMIDAFNITQDRITRSRLAGDPPDVLMAPKLQGIGLFEFHRAAEAIDRGREAAERVLADIREIVASAAEQAGRDQAVAM